jgi:signal-transduction protein with cAMP-binding, CBS, and nucleotidyltransferase domain
MISSWSQDGEKEDQMSIAGMLKGHELFRALSVEDVGRISGFSSVKNYEKGETVFRFGRSASHVFLLLEGSVYLRVAAENPELSIAVARVEKGELFGLSPLLGSKTYTTSGICRENASVLAIEARPFRDLLYSDCRTGLHIMGDVAHVYFTRYLQVLKNLQRVVNDLPLIP